MQEKYYAADPHNLITIEKGRVSRRLRAEQRLHARAAATQDWIRNQIAVQDPPILFTHTHRNTPFLAATSAARAAVSSVPESSRIIPPALFFATSKRFSGPKADRLELLRQTRTHTGQLFMLYSDAERRIDTILAEAESAAPPATELRDEYGVVHRLWTIAEPERVSPIQNAMTDQKLVIADGHHRYETALNYRNERRSQTIHPDRNAPYEFAMMTFINTRSEGLTILPTHRVPRIARFLLGRRTPSLGAVVYG